MANLGIIPVYSNNDLQMKEEELAQQQENSVNAFTDNLTAHIRKAWQIAREAKRPIEVAMIKSICACSARYWLSILILLAYADASAACLPVIPANRLDNNPDLS